MIPLDSYNFLFMTAVSYLACPYSDPDSQVKQRRLDVVTRAAFKLMQEGRVVYSPLTHNIPISQLGIQGRWTTWQSFDLPILSKCDFLIVLRLPGWETSPGVTAEIAHAKKENIPIEWMDPTNEWLDLLQKQTPATPLKELIEKLQAFSAERDWAQFHSPKNLAMNLGVEVGELMEPFRWLTEEQSYAPKQLGAIRDEIGDVFMVLVHLAHSLGIDPIEAAQDKLMKIAAKYPADKCKGLCHKYTEYDTP